MGIVLFLVGSFVVFGIGLGGYMIDCVGVVCVLVVSSVGIVLVFFVFLLLV